MRRLQQAISSVLLSLFLVPAPAFARMADDFSTAEPSTSAARMERAAARMADDSDEDMSEDDLMDMLDEKMMDPSMGYGGGYMPYPPMGGISIDVSLTGLEETPDYVGMSAYCTSEPMDSMKAARAQVEEAFQKVKTAVGSDGRVRKMGAPSAWPSSFDPMTGAPLTNPKYVGNLSFNVKFMNRSRIQEIFELASELACSPSYDVRLIDTQAVELEHLDTLASRLEKRKKVYEKFLGKRLGEVTGLYLSTWLDGYTYDPETNLADATINLNVSYSLGN